MAAWPSTVHLNCLASALRYNPEITYKLQKDLSEKLTYHKHMDLHQTLPCRLADSGVNLRHFPNLAHGDRLLYWRAPIRCIVFAEITCPYGIPQVIYFYNHSWFLTLTFTMASKELKAFTREDVTNVSSWTQSWKNTHQLFVDISTTKRGIW